MIFVVVVIVAFVAYAILKAKSRMNEANYLRATREVDGQMAQQGILNRPSWIENDNKERQFTKGVLYSISRTAVPLTYAVRGFMSPDASAVLFSVVAGLESNGASFTEQQVGAARYIQEGWSEISPSDQEDFKKKTLVEEANYRKQFK